jgi:protein-tyrosine phosphatase
MVDIHCHILPGLDDGATSLDVSLAMAEMAIADGITHAIATPHANSEFLFSPERVRELRDELATRLSGRLELATGCDFHLSFENLQDLGLDPAKYTLHQKNYLLLEFANYAIPPAIDSTLHSLLLGDVRPIITHPERNPLIRSHPEMLLRWLQLGCFVQVTAQSFSGRFGAEARRTAEGLLDCDMIHFVASDAHDTVRRPMHLSKARAIVAGRKGEEVAESLFHANPLAAFEGAPLPYIPEPRTPSKWKIGEIKEIPPEKRDPPKKPFWMFWKR